MKIYYMECIQLSIFNYVSWIKYIAKYLGRVSNQKANVSVDFFYSVEARDYL